MLFLLLQAQPSARIDCSPSSSASRLYTWLWRLILPFSPFFIPDWEGRRKKINNGAKWGGVRGQWGPWQVCQGKEGVREGKSAFVCVRVCVCEFMSVCCIRSGQEKQWPKASWVSGLSGIKFMTIDRSCVCVCVLDGDECVFVWIMVESDRGEESSYEAHYGQTSQWNKWIPRDVIVKTLPFMDPSLCPSMWTVCQFSSLIISELFENNRNELVDVSLFYLLS